MWWNKSEDKATKPSEAPPAAKEGAPTQPAKEFDADKLPERKKLPAALQRIAREQDKEENFFDELVEG